MRDSKARRAGSSPRLWASLAAAITLPTSSVLAQPQPTPGPPSIPLTSVAAASLSLPGAGITYQYGIEFVTIPGSTLNNAPWQGNGTPGDRAVGRGAVNYDYRIGRFEVTTAQWVAFFNAAYDRPPSEWLPFLNPPQTRLWGAVPDPGYSGSGRRWIAVTGQEMFPTGTITWREAAMYCNWLHNGQSTDRSAFLSGAYDVSTFGYLGQSSIFTDQQAHSPGARFWIPTLDEMILAGHYDPNRNGAGQGGWWRYNITSDTQPAYGPPGMHVRASGNPGPDPLGPVAQSNAGWSAQSFPGFDPNLVPLGAYPSVQSPWGLLDLSGGTEEWLEDIAYVNGVFPEARFIDGRGRDQSGVLVYDDISGFTWELPNIGWTFSGFRIAAAIPAPSLASSFLCFGTLLTARRSRRPIAAPSAGA